MVTLVDICNTLADVNSLLAKAGFDVENYPSSNLPSEFFKTSQGLKMLADAEPMPDSVYALNVFARLGPVVYLTSRPLEAKLITLQWLTKHGFPRGKIIFIQHKINILSRFRGSVLYADDDPAAALYAAEIGHQVHLIDWPYNRHVNHPNIRRVRGLEEGAVCAV